MVASARSKASITVFSICGLAWIEKLVPMSVIPGATVFTAMPRPPGLGQGAAGHVDGALE